MQDNQREPIGLLRRLLIGLGCVVLVAAVGLGTVFMLKNIIPKKEILTAVAVWKPSEIISAYTVPGAIHGLADNLYQVQSDTATDVLVRYTLQGHHYAVSTPTKNHVLFYAKGTSDHDDVKAVQDQTTVFMQTKGYEKVKLTTSSTESSPFYATYASTSAICQLVSSGPKLSATTPVSHILACTDRSAIEREYTLTETLLALYKATRLRLPPFTMVARSSAMQGDKALTILHFTTEIQKESPVLLFAAINNQWAYLANLNGDSGQPNAKYTLTPEIERAIRDPKYGDFLTKHLQGGTP